MKQVLVTGGAQRLGAEIVRQFAAAGWRVWCHYQRSESAAQTLQSELRATGAQVELVQADLAQSAVPCVRSSSPDRSLPMASLL